MKKKKLFISGLFLAISLTGLLSIWTYTKAAGYTDALFVFCENAHLPVTSNRDLNLVMNAWEEKEVCLDFSTSSEEPVEITYWFTEWQIDSHQMKLCDNDMTDQNNFAKYFNSSEWNNRSFQISTKDWHKIIKEKMRIPLGMSWAFFGCLAFKWKWLTKKDWQIFDMVFRKTAKINVMIWWSNTLQSQIQLLKNPWKIFSSNNRIKATLDKNNKLTLSFIVSNNWNIDQEISMSGSIYNTMGFEKEFSIQGKKVLWWSQIEVTANIWIIPFYKWPFKVDLKLIANPIFAFDTSNIDAKLKAPITIEENWQIFIFTRIRLVILLVALLIIRLIIRPLFKKHTA